MPWAPQRRCLEPGCRNRQAGPRCAVHEPTSTRNHRGVPRQDRGHGADYERRRRELLASAPLCAWNCGRRATTADYAVPFSRGGTLDDLVPACGTCNYGRGARLIRASA